MYSVCHRMSQVPVCTTHVRGFFDNSIPQVRHLAGPESAAGVSACIGEAFCMHGVRWTIWHLFLHACMFPCMHAHMQAAQVQSTAV